MTKYANLTWRSIVMTYSSLVVDINLKQNSTGPV